MGRRWLAGCVGLGLVVSAQACGGSSDSGLGSAGAGGSGGGGPALDTLPASLADAVCDAYEGCLGPIYALFANGADCRVNAEKGVRSGEFPKFQGAIDAGKVSYDGSKVAACLASLSGRTCSQLLDRFPAECEAVFAGTVAQGGDCSLDVECEGAAFCKSDGVCPGKCTAPLSAGQACTSSDQCQSGLDCSDDTGLCAAPAAQGASCGSGLPECTPGTICLGGDEDTGAPGTCLAIDSVFTAAIGASCDPATTLCATGGACALISVTPPDTLVWQCVSSTEYPAGGACKIGFPDACAAGQYCDVPPQSVDGTCRPVPSAGEACTHAAGRPCQSGLVCVNDVCTALAENGQPCAGNAGCYSDRCGASGGCVADLPCE